MQNYSIICHLAPLIIIFMVFFENILAHISKYIILTYYNNGFLMYVIVQMQPVAVSHIKLNIYNTKI